jgi:hypothetical protein
MENQPTEPLTVAQALHREKKAKLLFKKLRDLLVLLFLQPDIAFDLNDLRILWLLFTKLPYLFFGKHFQLRTLVLDGRRYATSSG